MRRAHNKCACYNNMQMHVVFGQKLLELGFYCLLKTKRVYGVQNVRIIYLQPLGKCYCCWGFLYGNIKSLCKNLTLLRCQELPLVTSLQNIAFLEMLWIFYSQE